MKLTIVPTPIGNLEDITLRALRILKEADTILAEDTRTSGNLLKHFEISSRLMPYHKFNEHKAIHTIIERIKAGEKIVLVSDAGTPSISDPGFLIARSCIENGIEVECLPGSTALIPALVNSGFPSDRFCFEGFLPQKKGRLKKIEMLKDETRTMIFYESPYRVIKALEQFAEIFGKDRGISVSRELTKIHEETVRGTIEEVLSYFLNHTVKGEFVIVVKGKTDDKDADNDN
ncbi:MAG: 16S rRNA (cytidine(1402)-2'-O)-methyltransferase [Bacteroidetes bacterium RIFOXYA12_FULL_35_11]|nr:MAG: 16S rRNA (cytidine(1402)-2'-O)-methyltransferase [Bacteroidetes bacterium GWF2_35_48]OFY77375.1 MAG: 16S rRNA (cytidine(1402)-2'-O)-methyltransferase [Bacteroidetes bacterium RIFOXYA12_FULL_35_11]OFY93832.1 MAG: 16S rRNA (cytidine(1402)-2'-O)-methyltransferase [Bacteroidetes bacterium RIFOXYC12_FULL_35_7]OFY94539.1 MAG: 16S rRNA (cytidine(1402)-2'-O)-methyltransferase [Bacteroidetes bacterium RIFOXYB2_FULL_35_7]HBX50887.1 16S rRNA (cytidine(1402)-2'-O)-methyltransferase [Bacteroidales b